MTTLSAGSSVRRPLKWGERTEKTTGRSPSALALEGLGRWGGPRVCGGGAGKEALEGRGAGASDAGLCLDVFPLERLTLSVFCP